MKSDFEPQGFRFFDSASNREMIFLYKDQPFAGWICYRHQDGQWVTLREATDQDNRAIDKALHDAHIKGDS